MKILIWAEIQKLRRSKIVGVAIFTTILIAATIFMQGYVVAYNNVRNIDSVGWYMNTAQMFATTLVFPAVVSLIGSYMICREEDEDVMKSLLIIPINETKLTTAKMIVTFAISILIYLLLFAITVLVEMSMHFRELSLSIVLDFFKLYFLQGVGVFFAISPIIALVSFMKKGYLVAIILTEFYSIAGLFVSMSDSLKTFYPMTAVFGLSGYYETTPQSKIGNIISLGLCCCLSILILRRLRYKKRD